MRWRSGTKIIGVLHQQNEKAQLELLSGSQITGITYLEKEAEEVKLLSASKFDVNLLYNATATGVLHRDQTATDVQLLPGSQIAGVLYEEAKEAELKLLRVAYKALKLVSRNAVRGLLYQQRDDTEIKLLSDISDLSPTAGALLIGVLHQESPVAALSLVSRNAVRGLLYQQRDDTEIKLLSDISDLSPTAGAQVAGILYHSEVSNL